MKGRNSNQSKLSKRTQSEELSSQEISRMESVRPHMIENGTRLVAQPGYPNRKIINRLAEIFSNQIIAERN